MAEAEQHLCDRPAYLQADATLRMHLLGTAFGKLIGRILYARCPWNRERPTSLDLELILDTDIPNQDARDWYTKNLEEDWSERSRIIWELNVQPKIQARFATEEAGRRAKGVSRHPAGPGRERGGSPRPVRLPSYRSRPPGCCSSNSAVARS